MKIAKQFIENNLPADEVAVGKAITRGIKNGINASDGFVGRFQAKSGVLFGELDKYIKPDKGLRIDTTIKELSKIVNPVKGAENTSKAFKNQFLSDILEGLNKDLIKNGGTLPYSALKSVKGKIGNKLGSFNLVDDVSTKELKTIYGSISEDIKLSLKGNTKGLNALSRANKYYNTGLDRINDYLLPLTKIKNPDTIASLLINSGKEGATRLNAIKKSLNKDQYNIFLSNVMERMGRLQPGQALSGDLVETSGRFSSETFLTNFNKLSKQAQDSLFEGKGWTKGLKKDFKEIVSITDFIRQSGKTFKNPSGTADRLVGQGLFLSGGASFLTGNPAFMLAVPLVIGTASTTAKLFTNPSFIKWLAQGIRIGNNKGADAVIQHLGRLGVVMGNADSESRQFINEYLQMILGQEKKD